MGGGVAWAGLLLLCDLMPIGWVASAVWVGAACAGFVLLHGFSEDGPGRMRASRHTHPIPSQPNPISPYPAPTSSPEPSNLFAPKSGILGRITGFWGEQIGERRVGWRWGDGKRGEAGGRVVSRAGEGMRGDWPVGQESVVSGQESGVRSQGPMGEGMRGWGEVMGRGEKGEGRAGREGGVMGDGWGCGRAPARQGRGVQGVSRKKR
ncbi:hypothetical protein FHX76_002751 [Lysinibacter cavernae]|uniref:Uncharacterized protein n=1 Tax=Lysinibacter cavernae TaxID=1640652 RepID=A0A7X5R387_9MICO|nr:hypothetical protein [Lysinibacter cavernae]